MANKDLSDEELNAALKEHQQEIREIEGEMNEL